MKEMEEPEKIEESALSALKQQLESAGIDISKWGTGEARTLAHLQKEIENGESVLVTGREGELLRKVEVCGADIYYVFRDGKKYRLKEERQVFKDGRERQRDLGHSISEKMKPDENPNDAMARGIKEELGLEGEVDLIETGIDEQLKTSRGYPGLQSQYILHKFEAVLGEEQFKSDGYIEEQPDKTTYFVWEEVKA